MLFWCDGCCVSTCRCDLEEQCCQDSRGSYGQRDGGIERHITDYPECPCLIQHRTQGVAFEQRIRDATSLCFDSGVSAGLSDATPVRVGMTLANGL